MDLMNHRERREHREEEEERKLANYFKLVCDRFFIAWELLSFFSAPSAPSVVK
jgi:thymidylate kinase